MQNIKINDQGIYLDANFIASPNRDARPDANDISLIVIHNISLPPNQYGGEAVTALFTNQLDPEAHPYYAEISHLKVSSHFFIRRDGSIIQFASCNDRAWHAGKSIWEGREQCNDFSIGIELEGSDFEAFEPPQYQTLNVLIEAIKVKYPIKAITGHSNIAPDRKTDPGPYFDWSSIHT